MKRNLKLGLALLSLLLTVSCLHKSGSNGEPIPVSPWERVMVGNASFSQILSDAELGTESLVATGVITAEQAKLFIKWEGQLAEDHKPITAILKQGPAVTGTNIATVNAFFDQVQVSGLQLINSGDAGIKNPQTQQTLGADVQALVALAKTLTADIAAAKGGQ